MFPHSPKGWLAVMSIDRPLVSRADQFEQNARLRLILGDIGEVVEDQQMIFVELGDRGFEGKIAACDLKLFAQGRWSCVNRHAPAPFDQRQAERRRQMRFPAAGRDGDSGAGISGGRSDDPLRLPSTRGQGRGARPVGASCTAAIEHRRDSPSRRHADADAGVDDAAGGGQACRDSVPAPRLCLARLRGLRAHLDALLGSRPWEFAPDSGRS